jgi:hypothetical protein
MFQACCWGVWASNAPVLAMNTKSTADLGLAKKEISPFMFRIPFSCSVRGVFRFMTFSYYLVALITVSPVWLLDLSFIGAETPLAWVDLVDSFGEHGDF